MRYSFPIYLIGRENPAFKVFFNETETWKRNAVKGSYLSFYTGDLLTIKRHHSVLSVPVV